ncbi:unnamed protein product [Nippostrongylus brasiliensis]|uniref:Paired domain-containing protein n=1 Tax=Nippostrongylus brasiliensis TaxID=27835 RepID=A0A0N4YH39_NIPBR|nr:unnamed protein product [Nippostrongylus brasiliensis]
MPVLKALYVGLVVTTRYVFLLKWYIGRISKSQDMQPYSHRDTIAHLVDEGLRPAEISKRLMINARTVPRIAAQYEQRGHCPTLVKAGRSRTVSTSGIREIIKKRIQRNGELSLNKIASDLNISRCSVQNIVKNELGLGSYRIYRGQALTDLPKRDKLEKCRKLLDFICAGRLSGII